MVSWMKITIKMHFRVRGQVRGEGESDEEEEEGGDITGVEFVEAGTILDEDNGLEYQLPKHQRCACHLLNLISTVDALKANGNPVYKRLSRSAFSKCSSLWSKSSRSSTAAEIIEDNCKLQLLRPNMTRWNLKDHNVILC